MVISGEQAIRMPQKGNKILQFQNYYKQMPAPFVIYADFEAITEKVQGCQPSDAISYIHKYQKHTGCSFGYKVVCCYNDKYTKTVKIFRGEDSINKLMQQMLSEVQYCQKIINTKFKKSLSMTNEEEQMFKTAVECLICGQKYKETDIQVRDHCDITGQYRGSAHQDCNLKLRINPKQFERL